MKYDIYSEYQPDVIALAESAFLTVWAGLASWHDDLVLVGGMVPKYLCGDLNGTRHLPRPATLDVDLGIALAADSGQYGSLRMELNGQGFRADPQHQCRFVKTINGVSIPIDFLVEKAPKLSGTAAVEDITAGILPGINRALKSARNVEVAGVDLHGARQKLTARVCEVGPFIAMKLRAFANRQQPKDAFDLLYTLLHYDGGTDKAIIAFAQEVRVGNPACPEAMRCLESHFSDESSPAPAKAAHFVLGPVATGESEDMRFMRLRIQQDLVTVAAMLRQAVAG
jgi:hypothetical protein